MTLGRSWKVVLAIVLFCAFVFLTSLLLGLTDRALDLWERLQTLPAVVRFGVLGGFVLLSVGFVVVSWKLIAPRQRNKSTSPTVARMDASALKARAEGLALAGADTAKAQETLSTIADAAEQQTLDIVLFGSVSTGKSSLAKALLPEAMIEVSPLAGSTTQARRFQWQAATGAQIHISDLPGLEAVGGELDEAMMEEARRAHVVVFVTDGDLTRQQVAALERLREAGKPLIVSLNKADRYSDAQRDEIKASITQRLSGASGPDDVAPVLVVTIAGGEREVLRRDATGQEQLSIEARSAEVTELVLALEELVGGNLAAVNSLRERALLDLADDQLKHAEYAYRDRRAAEIVAATTRKAVVGALAAVTPGTDIVIQGYLGSDLTRQLCRLYGQEARDIEISRFLDLSQSRVGKVVPITLAIAGNALKAFPGVGTLAGGLVHAVAYGTIFDAVGRGLAKSLAEANVLDAEAAASAVSEALDSDLQTDVNRIARLAWSQLRDRES
ncbi:MAG: GTPase [Pseudomonadota bacterium]